MENVSHYPCFYLLGQKAEAVEIIHHLLRKKKKIKSLTPDDLGSQILQSWL